VAWEFEGDVYIDTMKHESVFPGVEVLYKMDSREPHGKVFAGRPCAANVYKIPKEKLPEWSVVYQSWSY